MKKTDLISLTVVDLKALAKKKNVSLSTGGKKDDIIKALIAADKVKKPSKKKAGVTAKTGKAQAKKPQTTKKTSKKGAAARRPASGSRSSNLKKSGVTTPAKEWKMPPGVEEPLMAQERVSESKYYTGPALQPVDTSYGALPRGYGEDKITIMTRDPFVAYAYWETTPERLEREKAWFGWDSKLCVRIYDITGVQFDGSNAIGYYDQDVFERIGSWYFDFGRPTHSFCADLGLLSPGGRFLTLARSNYITMPRDGVSEVIDEEWMLVDEEFWKLYGYPEGFRRGVSSPEMQEMVRRRRILEMTSPGLFSRERAKRK
jgi:hypothetical protein